MHRLDTDAADAAVSEAFAVLDERHPELASAWALRSWVLLHRDEIPEAASAARNALRLAFAHGTFEDRARAYSALTKPLVSEIGPGIEVYANEAVRLAREHRHDGYLFEALVSREVLRQICLQPHREEALASAREAVEIAERMDSAPAEGAARIILGVVSSRRRDAERELTSEAASSCAIMVASIMRRVTLARCSTRAADRRSRNRPGRDRRRDVPARRGLARRCLRATTWQPATSTPRAATWTRLARPRRRCTVSPARRWSAGAEILAASGDLDGAGAGRSGRRGQRRRLPAARPMAARGRASAAIRPGGVDAAVAEASAALPLADTVAQPFERRGCCYYSAQPSAAGGSRRAAGRPGSLHALLSEALEVFERQAPGRPSTRRSRAGPAGRLPGDSRDLTEWRRTRNWITGFSGWQDDR